MKKEKDYLEDLAEIRFMMERSSKFLSLSGWAGVMAGAYALVGAYVAHTIFNFKPTEAIYNASELPPFDFFSIAALAIGILVLSLATAIILSKIKATKRAEPVWNATSRRLLTNMAIPLVSGGILILIFLIKGLIGLLAPLTLLFYGLALYNAGNYTYKEVRILGIIQIGLGLISSHFIENSLILWAVGFGLINIIYGIYIHAKYDR